MTNIEYKKIALEILNELNAEFEINDDDNITNISELFLLKIREALLKSRKKENSYTVAKELDFLLNIFSTEDDFKTIDNKSYLGSYTTVNMSNIEKILNHSSARMAYFRNLHFFINSFSNAENILLNIGIKNPQELVYKIKNIDDITTDENKEEAYSIIAELEKIDDEKQVFLAFLFIYYWLKHIIFVFLETEYFDKIIIITAKSIKKIVENHQDIYIERFKKYFFITEHIDEYLDEHIESVLRIIMKILNKDIQKKNYLKGIIDNEENEFPFSAALIMDLVFLLYFITYETPSWIKLGFLLTSENAPYHLRLAMIESLQDNKYSPIIQYEYECFCKKNTNFSIPLQFYFGKPINLDSLNIEYYKLEQWNMDVHSYLLNKKRPTSNKIEIINRPNRDKIIHDLKPYFKVFDKRSSKEKGFVFIKDYLSDVITLSENLKGSLAVHGFAYIIYKSKFFNWGKEIFDASFVYKIAEIFNIKHMLKTEYPLNKCQAKAENMLKKESSLQGLWD